MRVSDLPLTNQQEPRVPVSARHRFFTAQMALRQGAHKSFRSSKARESRAKPRQEKPGRWGERETSCLNARSRHLAERDHRAGRDALTRSKATGLTVRRIRSDRGKQRPKKACFCRAFLRAIPRRSLATRSRAQKTAPNGIAHKRASFPFHFVAHSSEGRSLGTICPNETMLPKSVKRSCLPQDAQLMVRFTRYFGGRRERLEEGMSV